MAVNVLIGLQKSFSYLFQRLSCCQPNKSSTDICIIDAVSFLWVDSNGLEEHAASNFTCEELKHCWLEVSIWKVLRPTSSTQVFLGFPGSTSKC
jgi:hypothetical protein